MNNKTCLKILSSVKFNEKFLVAGKLISGEVKVNQCFESQKNSNKFLVRGIGFVPYKAYEEGKVAIMLIPHVDNQNDILEDGEILVVAHQS